MISPINKLPRFPIAQTFPLGFTTLQSNKIQSSLNNIDLTTITNQQETPRPQIKDKIDLIDINTITKTLVITILDIFLSGITYAITAMGCLGWGKTLFPKHERLIEKQGANIATGLNTGISVGRVFLSPSITPLSLGLAATSPTVTNLLYRWASANHEKRYNKANNTVYSIGVLAKASKRFSSVEEAKAALLESILSRLGRNVTKEKMFEILNTSKNPQTNGEQLKTISSKLVSKYTWNFLCFGLLDWLFETFTGTVETNTKKEPAKQ